MENLTTEIVQSWIEALNRNTAEVKRLADIEELKFKKWLNPEEACTVLGFPINGKYNHRRKLQWCRENGYLVKFQDTRPIMYWREEVYNLAEKIALGKVQVPHRW